MGLVGRVRRSRHPAKHRTIIPETDAPAAPVAPAETWVRFACGWRIVAAQVSLMV
ncbi:AtzH-like domain-containing protein [Enterobacter cloacae complex sp. CARB60]|uniref:AtzH-like domain-containing protein n=1 Tax=Enterobacter cloacae complex sp. CARB60 TaxID=3119569 RepID=UPI003FA4A460